jgi:hypothetical protein
VASILINKNPNQKQPGEKEPGKFHYNPGNMSEKIIGQRKDKSKQQADTEEVPAGQQDQNRR